MSRQRSWASMVRRPNPVVGTPLRAVQPRRLKSLKYFKGASSPTSSSVTLDCSCRAVLQHKCPYTQQQPKNLLRDFTWTLLQSWLSSIYGSDSTGPSLRKGPAHRVWNATVCRQCDRSRDLSCGKRCASLGPSRCSGFKLCIRRPAANAQPCIPAPIGTFWFEDPAYVSAHAAHFPRDSHETPRSQPGVPSLTVNLCHC